MNNKNLESTFRYVLNNYLTEKQSSFEKNELSREVRKDIPNLMYEQLNLDQKKYAITGSVGKGNWATIPWVGFFDRSITSSATKGYYLVYLFKSDMSGFYLSLNQGYTYFSKEYGAKLGREKARTAASIMRSKINVPSKFNLKKIDLASQKDLAIGYENGHIMGIYYDINAIPDNSVLIQDFNLLLESYQKLKTLLNDRSAEEFNRYILLNDDNAYLENNEIEYQQAVDRYSSIVKEEDPSLDEKPRPRKQLVIDESGRQKYPRDVKEATTALIRAGYKCEVESEHSTFLSKSSGQPYCEAHHFVGISRYDNFPDVDLDRAANIICLCANCHRKIHYGVDEDRVDMIEKLYEQVNPRLEKVGIQVTLNQVKEYYGIGN